MSDLAREIWLFCLVNEIELSAQYVGAGGDQRCRSDVEVEGYVGLQSAAEAVRVAVAVFWAFCGGPVYRCRDGSVGSDDGQAVAVLRAVPAACSNGNGCAECGLAHTGQCTVCVPSAHIARKKKVVQKISLAPVSVVLIAPVWQKPGDFVVVSVVPGRAGSIAGQSRQDMVLKGFGKEFPDCAASRHVEGQALRDAVGADLHTRSLCLRRARLMDDALWFAILSESAQLTRWMRAEFSLWESRIWGWNRARVRLGFSQIGAGGKKYGAARGGRA